jgi:hypothetical protein
MKRIFTHIVFLIIAATVFAQNIPVRDPFFIRDIEKSSLLNDTIKHSSIKPYYFSDVKNICADSLQYDKGFLYYSWKSKSGKKPSSFYALPVYEVFNWFDLDKNILYGLNIHLIGLFDYSIGDKFGISYQLTGWLLQNTPEYMITNLYYQRIYDGLGRTFRNTGDILIENDIHISYSPYSFLRLELANSKNFFGDGYRSFLLSDFASNYPYFKLETNFLSLKYSCVWAVQNSYLLVEDSVYGGRYFNNYNKFNVFHYLDWKIGKRINLGVFESIITRNNNFFTFEYMNPIIFFRPVEFSLGSEDNALMGTNFNLTINNRNALYGQFVIDDIIVGQLLNDIKHRINPEYVGEYGWFANKWAAQAGIKSYDIFKIKNLDIFTEFNIARPYTYSHVHPEQNYSHKWQPLAHPLGANFIESVSGLSYLGKRIIFDAKLMYAFVGADTTGTHFGQNIFNPTMDGVQGYTYIVNSYGNTVLQGIKTNVITARIDFGYILKENKNLSLNVGLIFRKVSPEIGEASQQTYLYFGVKSNFVKREMVY